MKTHGIIGLMKYLIVCLSLICFDQADDSFSADMSGNEPSFTGFLIPESDLIQTDDCSFSAPEAQCRIPRQTSVSNTCRTITQAHRQNPTNHSRSGFTLMKSGKSMNGYTTSLFFMSILNFPSGMNETGNHLISLGKLII